MKKLYPILILILILTGCAAPGPVKEKANNILKPVCYEKFIDNSLGSYQHFAHQFSPKVVFAYAEDASSYVCGDAYWGELVDNMCLVGCSPTWSQIEALALSRCESAKSPSFDKKKPCKLFARNNEIVWEEYKKEDAKFQ
jgi:hypothetical protein